MKKDIQFIKQVITKSKDSAEEGFFPAGAIVAKGEEILSEMVSAKFPDYKHAEYKAIDEAFEKIKAPLSECTLYASMEPCLMCLSKAYWAGIRKIVFTISKERLNVEYYEGDSENIKFNDDIELIHKVEYEEEALAVVRDWESKLGT